jgi:amino acid transporter
MEKKLGLSALTALVLSSMLGAGVFSLPQNMAAVASPAALLIGWGITGAGICCWPSPCCCSPAFARIWTAVFSPMRVKVSAN